MAAVGAVRSWRAGSDARTRVGCRRRGRQLDGVHRVAGEGGKLAVEAEAVVVVSERELILEVVACGEG